MAHILIVEARFYEHLNDMLLDGVRSTLEAEGHSHETVTVPGALEVPAAIGLGDQTQRFDGYVALGVIIRGETYHFEVVSNESARGIMALTLDGLAIGNGILTVENEEQALARADKTRKDKGGDDPIERTIWRRLTPKEKREKKSQWIHWLFFFVLTQRLKISPSASDNQYNLLAQGYTMSPYHPVPIQRPARCGRPNQGWR
jgi:6,7-dimethyl-8-ribityllumazine synthase